MKWLLGSATRRKQVGRTRSDWPPTTLVAFSLSLLFSLFSSLVFSSKGSALPKPPKRLGGLGCKECNTLCSSPYMYHHQVCSESSSSLRISVCVLPSVFRVALKSANACVRLSWDMSSARASAHQNNELLFRLKNTKNEKNTSPLCVPHELGWQRAHSSFLGSLRPTRY